MMHTEKIDRQIQIAPLTTVSQGFFVSPPEMATYCRFFTLAARRRGFSRRSAQILQACLQTDLPRVIMLPC
jgi:hypothetical protein